MLRFLREYCIYQVPFVVPRPRSLYLGKIIRSFFPCETSDTTEIVLLGPLRRKQSLLEGSFSARPAPKPMRQDLRLNASVFSEQISECAVRPLTGIVNLRILMRLFRNSVHTSSAVTHHVTCSRHTIISLVSSPQTVPDVRQVTLYYQPWQVFEYTREGAASSPSGWHLTGFLRIQRLAHMRLNVWGTRFLFLPSPHTILLHENLVLVSLFLLSLMWRFIES